MPPSLNAVSLAHTRKVFNGNCMLRTAHVVSEPYDLVTQQSFQLELLRPNVRDAMLWFSVSNRQHTRQTVPVSFINNSVTFTLQGSYGNHKIRVNSKAIVIGHLQFMCGNNEDVHEQEGFIVYSLKEFGQQQRNVQAQAQLDATPMLTDSPLSAPSHLSSQAQPSQTPVNGTHRDVAQSPQRQAHPLSTSPPRPSPRPSPRPPLQRANGMSDSSASHAQPHHPSLQRLSSTDSAVGTRSQSFDRSTSQELPQRDVEFPLLIMTVIADGKVEPGSKYLMDATFTRRYCVGVTKYRASMFYTQDPAYEKLGAVPVT